jgi:hypothetical protein
MKFIHPWFDAPGMTDDHRAKLELLRDEVFKDGLLTEVVMKYQKQWACSLPVAIDDIYDMAENGVYELEVVR